MSNHNEFPQLCNGCPKRTELRYQIKTIAELMTLGKNFNGCIYNKDV